MDAPLTPVERVAAVVALLSPALGLMLLAAVCTIFGLGCSAFYEHSGSKVNVGSLVAPVEVSDSSDAVTVRALYSMDGASVWTARDSLVTVNYRNAYTNQYFGIVKTQGEQDLAVRVEPLEVGGGAETNDLQSVSK